MSREEGKPRVRPAVRRPQREIRGCVPNIRPRQQNDKGQSARAKATNRSHDSDTRKLEGWEHGAYWSARQMTARPIKLRYAMFILYLELFLEYFILLYVPPRDGPRDTKQ